jgi:threonine synthase
MFTIEELTVIRQSLEVINITGSNAKFLALLQEKVETTAVELKNKIEEDLKKEQEKEIQKEIEKQKILDQSKKIK